MLHVKKPSYWLSEQIFNGSSSACLFYFFIFLPTLTNLAEFSTSIFALKKALNIPNKVCITSSQASE